MINFWAFIDELDRCAEANIGRARWLPFCGDYQQALKAVYNTPTGPTMAARCDFKSAPVRRCACVPFDVRSRQQRL